MIEVLLSLPVLFVALLVSWVVIPRFSSAERSYIWASLAAHLGSAVTMVLVTTYYYGGGDMTNYFAAGQFLASHLRNDFLNLAPTLLEVVLQQESPLPVPSGLMMGSNTGSMQALSGFMVFFFQDSIYAVCLAIAAASFFGKLGIYRVVRRELPDVPIGPVCFACLLLPSTVFWSAGLLKEPFAMLGLAGLIWGGHAMAVDRKFALPLPAFILGALTAGLLKGYVLLVFGISAGIWFLARSIRRRLGGIELRGRYVLGGMALAIATLLIASSSLPQFAPEVIADEARTAQAAGAHVEGGSYYDLGSNESVGSQVPLAMATVFFRPLLVEVSNPLILLNALEMTWITVMVLVVIFRRPLPETLRLISGSPMLAFAVAFVVTMSVGVGLTTTNLGTLSRYRMPLMGFYALSLVVLAAPTLAERTARAHRPPTARERAMT